MNGRLESKIKIEKRTLESIKDSGYNLTSFFNSLAAKYEASSKETYITYIINFLKAMNKPVSEITSDEINNYFIDLTYKTMMRCLLLLKSVPLVIRSQCIRH